MPSSTSSGSDDDPRPIPPVAPDQADCCGEGCVHCILDIYDVALEKYAAALAAWLARHPEATENA